MKNIPAVSPGSAQTLEPATEGAADELRDTLVPAQEDELPQGVLDLLATLSVRHRSEALVPLGVQNLDRRGLVESIREQVESSHRRTPKETHSNVGDQGLDRRGLDTRLREQVESSHRRSHMETYSNVGASLLAKATVPAPIDPQGSPRVSIEAPSTTPEPLSKEQAANISTPTTLAADAPLPEALMNLHSVRHALSAAPVSIPLPATPIPKPALDMMIETLPGSSRGLLQVPFNKGAASGQVTITRVPDDPVQNLQLSPSNTLVFEQLKAPFELARDPGWRLTDTGGEQQHQGSQQQPDEEQAEQQELPA
ncbi:hypothetical protein KJF94_05855 [Pseudomonas hormoni]|uniref:Surface presentation of antigen domain-containing protein n=1 Tax=Pseudomonas hormoni TaxID=3093767 RepID=A0ABX8F293_9PSED|nr:hypothetical protein [Pseudomonas hormoni]QVW25108.1 hypothetical protein KJF94_05855 [Pseudomonas hormoni]